MRSRLRAPRPGGRARCGERRVPDLARGLRVDLAVQQRERLPRVAIVGGEWPAAEEAVLSGERDRRSDRSRRGRRGSRRGRSRAARDPQRARRSQARPGASGRPTTVSGSRIRVRLSPQARGWAAEAAVRAPATSDAPSPPAGRTRRRSAAGPTSSSPSRKVVLSQPSSSTGAIGRSAQCGNCAASSRATSAGVMAALFTFEPRRTQPGCLAAAEGSRAGTGALPSRI